MLHPGCAGPCLVPIWMRSIFELKKNGGTQNPRLYPREFQVPLLCCAVIQREHSCIMGELLSIPLWF